MSDQTSETPTTARDEIAPEPKGEALCAPSTGVRRLFIVTVQEIIDREVHQQDWKVIYRKDREEKYGHVTTVQTKREERLVFRAESSVCPSLSTIARLMDGDAPEAR